MNRKRRRIVVSDLDLDPVVFSAAKASGRVAWDIETSGLDWSADQIGTCQIATDDVTNIVLVRGRRPGERMRAVLECPDVHKVFHHAPFDLRFMHSKWGTSAQNVGCTKIASKILNPHLAPTEHSLQPALLRHLGVAISKREQASNWLAPDLTDSQLDYAAGDVEHLLLLEDQLVSDCDTQGVLQMVRSSWRYLPTRAALDIRGAGDVFAY